MNPDQPHHETARLVKSVRVAETARDVLDQTGQSSSAAKLSEAINAAKEARFAIGVVGIAKRGKSTLVNGLLGRSDDLLAPVDRPTATNVVSCFANNPKLKVRVLFQSDESGGNSEDITPENIRQYACEEFNPGNWKGVKMIEAMGPFPRLGDGTVLVDTPGADNASNSVHDLVLLDFLPRMDAVIFLVTADEPLTQAEVELLKCVRHNDVRKLVFAINKADKVDSAELSEAIAHNRRILGSIGYGDAPIIPISAKAFHENGSDIGIQKLLRVINNLISGGRAEIMAARLDDLVLRFVTEAKDVIGDQLQLAELTTDQIREETQTLKATRQEFERNRGRWEREFVSSWQQAFENFEETLDKVEKRMVSDYTSLVETTSPIKLSALAGTIHTEIIVRLDELLEQPITELNRRLVEASDKVANDLTRSMRIAPRSPGFTVADATPLKGIGGILAAGAPGAITAAIAATLPGGIGSLIISMAPSVATATWNPLTWVAAAASGAANAAVTAAGAGVTALLAPIATVVSPLAIAVAGYRVYAKWRAQVFDTRNKLLLGVKDLTKDAIAEARRNTREARSRMGSVFEQFTRQIESKIEDYGRNLKALEDNRPDPTEIASLKEGMKLIDSITAGDPDPPNSTGQGNANTLFTL